MLQLFEKRDYLAQLFSCEFCETSSLTNTSSGFLEQEINPFVPNAPFLYNLKASENLTDFLCFQGVEKGCIGNEWVNWAGAASWIFKEIKQIYVSSWIEFSQIFRKLLQELKYFSLHIRNVPGYSQRKRCQHLLVQSHESKHKDNVSKLFKVVSKDTRTTSLTLSCCLCC